MTSALVAVGIGNTTVKIGRVSQPVADRLPDWSHRCEMPTAEFRPADLAEFLTDEPHDWVVASVQRSAEQRLRDWVHSDRPDDDFQLLTYRDIPLEIDVEAPERVGMDRLAAAVAVNRLRNPALPAVFIDAGTALTVNLVTADGVFRGGVILPGFKLTTQALAAGTDRLPLITPDWAAAAPPVLGKSTEGAIRSGLFWGSIGAVRELMMRMGRDLSAPPAVYVTGGDAQRLTEFLSADAKFVPDLVLIGIVSSVVG